MTVHIDPTGLTCPQCRKPYASQGGSSFVKMDTEDGRQAVFCRVCWLTTERNAYRDLCQPEARWEPALTPESKVTLTLTGADLDDLAEACRVANARNPGTPMARWRKLNLWLRAVINKGPADAGGCLADYEG